MTRRASQYADVAVSDRDADWETPAGPIDAAANPGHTRPAFTYRGYAESHWRGQTCHLIGENAPEGRIVAMACGCRASVPWWTLEPVGPTPTAAFGQPESPS